MKQELFYSNIDRTIKSEKIFNILETYSKNFQKQVYVLDKPLGEKERYNYGYKDAMVIFIPKTKVLFLNLSPEREEEFTDYVEDYIEDLGYISDKYGYKETLGRPRFWREKLIEEIVISSEEEVDNFEENLERYKLENEELIRKGELLISLVIGSINDIERIKGSVPDNLLDKVKRKIILFDGDQTRFIYQNLNQKTIRIQGMAGTGKTELLLHKLKELYMKDSKSKIVLTCHNKILHNTLKERIPNFFDFMKVEEQIKWEERLWCMPSWGSKKDKNSGLYSYICHTYELHFKSFGYFRSFQRTCEVLLEELKKLENIKPCFDYILIDESQDFPKEFIEICELIVKKSIYVAGDIFQNIFDINIKGDSSPDFLLNKCYRTDPKTLMFAHALGMGLFEKDKISWLDEEGWQACGYEVQKYEEENKFILSRKPLRRFEDLETIDSIELLSLEKDKYNVEIIKILLEIKKNNPTVKPDDIAIVFLEDQNINYLLMDELTLQIEKYIGWEVNKGYETKERRANTLLISNRNNVKGLEFPFIICVSSKEIDRNFKKRNALYMMLTRSFLKTYFIFSNSNSQEFKDVLKVGLKKIIKEGKLEITIPTNEEKKQIMTEIEMHKNHKKSASEMIDDAIKKLKIDSKFIAKIKQLVLTNLEEPETPLEISEEHIYELVEKAFAFFQKLE